MDLNLVGCYTLVGIHPFSALSFGAFDSIMVNHTSCDLLHSEHLTFLNDFGVPYCGAFDDLDFHITTTLILAIHDFDNLFVNKHCFDNLHIADVLA